MVYDKNRSGDPDYDDKQPQEFHQGGPVVRAGDGEEVIMSKVLGPVDENGAHVNLAVSTEDLDNRPSPGNVAEKPSTVQDYSAEDTPTFVESSSADSGDVEQARLGHESVAITDAVNSGVISESDAVSDKPATDTRAVRQAETPTTPAKAAKPGK